MGDQSPLVKLFLGFFWPFANYSRLNVMAIKPWCVIFPSEMLNKSNFPSAWAIATNQSQQVFGLTLGGEFSTAINDCGLWYVCNFSFLTTIRKGVPVHLCRVGSVVSDQLRALRIALYGTIGQYVSSQGIRRVLGLLT